MMTNGMSLYICFNTFLIKLCIDRLLNLSLSLSNNGNEISGMIVQVSLKHLLIKGLIT